jgi:hypothetical protein
MWPAPPTDRGVRRVRRRINANTATNPAAAIAIPIMMRSRYARGHSECNGFRAFSIENRKNIFRSDGIAFAQARAPHMWHQDSRRAERRQARRSPYPANVHIDAELVLGRDISALGLAVEMAHPLELGDIVQVTLSTASADGALPEIGAPARVVRLDAPRSEWSGVRVGLEFVG